MADERLTSLNPIPQGDVDNNVLLYCVDVTGGNISYNVNRANLYLAVNNIFTKGQTISPVLESALAINPASAPVGTSSEFVAADYVKAGTVAFASSHQTGDYVTNKIEQATLTNFSLGTIPNASSLKISGSPIASTNVTITNAFALWVAGGISRFDEQVKFTSATNTPLSITPTSAPVGSGSEFIAGINSLAGTVGFVTTAQTGDYISRKMGQATLTNPSSGTVPNATTLKILGAPIASTNVTITNAYALWVVAGTSKFDGGITSTGGITMSGANIALGSNQITTTNYSTLKERSLAGFITGLTLERTTTNAGSVLGTIPNGTNNSSGLIAYRTSDLTNYEIFMVGSDLVNANEISIAMQKAGTGTLRPLNIYMNATKLMSFDTANTITSYVQHIFNIGDILLKDPVSGSKHILVSSNNLFIQNAAQNVNLLTILDSGSVRLSSQIDIYNGIVTSGIGLSTVYGSFKGSLSSATQSNVINYTPPASTGKYRVSATVATTAGTNTGTITCTIVYKDAAGISKTILPPFKQTGSATFLTSCTGSSLNFETDWNFYIDNSATAITVTFTVTGTVVYFASATLEQVA